MGRISNRTKAHTIIGAVAVGVLFRLNEYGQTISRRVFPKLTQSIRPVRNQSDYKSAQNSNWDR